MMAAPCESPRSPVQDVDLISALQRRIVTGKLDIGTALWQAASSGSTETLELVLKLPNGMPIALLIMRTKS